MLFISCLPTVSASTHSTFPRAAPSPMGDAVSIERRRAARGPFDYAWQSAIRVATDLDGTLGDPTDDDEEWVLEVCDSAPGAWTPRPCGREARRRHSSMRHAKGWREDLVPRGRARRREGLLLLGGKTP